MIQIPLLDHQSICALGRDGVNTHYIEIFECPHSFGHAWRMQPSPFHADEVLTSACLLYDCKYLQSGQVYMSCTFDTLGGVTCHSHHTDTG